MTKTLDIYSYGIPICRAALAYQDSDIFGILAHALGVVCMASGAISAEIFDELAPHLSHVCALHQLLSDFVPAIREHTSWPMCMRQSAWLTH